MTEHTTCGCCGSIIEVRPPYPMPKPNAIDWWLVCVTAGLIAGLWVTYG